jgi:hypothetical protein
MGVWVVGVGLLFEIWIVDASIFVVFVTTELFCLTVVVLNATTVMGSSLCVGGGSFLLCVCVL